MTDHATIVSQDAPEPERQGITHLVIQAAKDVVHEHDRIGSTSASRRATIIRLREALYRLKQAQG